MLSTRLMTGVSMIGLIVAVLGIDEWFAPWFPLWFVSALVILGAASLELVGLLNATSARPSGNTVFGGVMAIVLANWAPHLTSMLAPAAASSSTAHPFDPTFPVSVLAWPLLAFVGVLM